MSPADQGKALNSIPSPQSLDGTFTKTSTLIEQMQKKSTHTCLRIFEHPIVLCRNLGQRLLTVDCTAWRYHRRVVFIHHVQCDWAYESTVNVLRVRQALCKLLKLLQSTVNCP